VGQGRGEEVQIGVESFPPSNEPTVVHDQEQSSEPAVPDSDRQTVEGRPIRVGHNSIGRFVLQSVHPER